MATVTSQQAFHPMRGHVEDGVQVKMDNGETLTIKASMRGWNIANERGETITAMPCVAHEITAFIVGYGQ